MLLRIDISRLESTTTMQVAGEIDLDTVTLFSTAISDAIADGAHDLVIDLDKVDYLDSSGLGALVSTHKRLSSIGGAVTVRCRQARVLRLFELTGLTQVLTVDGTDESPLAEPATG